ncbi:hypothetical protein LSCM4_00295 [Leishmania orientalis]|uniref:Uncharacterized protein n=1 Tax=Leishmania orientalis TaxID=2249476 RepID=A0A836FZM7_9TRYP|nr:hypothetical protein LSCM4_00295 [Leishmania orientalis]
MSAARARPRYGDQPPSSSRWRYYEDEVYGQPINKRGSRPTPHRRYSSPQQKPQHSRGVDTPRKGLGFFAREPHRYPTDDHAPEDDPLPLRRQSTQPPRRHSSPISHHNGDNERKWVYQRRAVEPTSPQRDSTERKRYSWPRHAASIYHAWRTAPTAAENSERAPPHRSARTSTSGSPRRSHRQHEASQVGNDSVARSSRHRHRHSSASPRRSHGTVGSPSRREHRASSSLKPRHAPTEPHARSPQVSARRHRHSDTTSPISSAHATETTRRHDTLRYRSPHHAEMTAESEATPLRSRGPSRAKGGRSPEKEACSPARRRSAHRTRSSRPESRPHSERRRRHHHASAPGSADEESRRSRHTPLPRPLSEDRYAVRLPTTESKYVRPAANSHTPARPRSGSYIEVISVHSGRQGSTNGWSNSHSSALHSPRRPRDDGPPAVIPSPQGQEIMQRIDSTRLWIQKMKEEVKKDRERVLQEGEGATLERSARHSVRKEHLDSTSRAGSASRHRTSSSGSRGHAPAAIPTGASSDGSRRASERPAPPKHAKRHRSSRRSAKTSSGPGPTPRTPTPNPDLRAVTMGIVEGSREGGVECPIFSFMSFLDGSTFDSTARLCQYNVDLAAGLSDEHLDILRAAVFDHNEEAFAELLYGDDVEAEISGVAATLGRSEDPAVQRELVLLQRAAVKRFNEKCTKALKTLLSANGGLGEAVQATASQLERHARQVHGPAMAAS